MQTVFCLVLSEEQHFCLRLMVRAVVTNKLRGVAMHFRNKPEYPDSAYVNDTLVLAELLRDMDQPLLLAKILYLEGVTKELKVALNSREFSLLGEVVQYNFVPATGPMLQQPEQLVQQMTDRVRAAQPGLQTIFKAAEEQRQLAILQEQANTPKPLVN